jgi:hypothetical protein
LTFDKDNIFVQRQQGQGNCRRAGIAALILPDGQISEFVSSPSRKNIPVLF